MNTFNRVVNVGASLALWFFQILGMTVFIGASLYALGVWLDG